MKVPKLAYILPGIFTVIIFIFIVFENFFQPSYWCKMEKEFNEANYKGIVVKKFIDKENHSQKTIQIKSSNEIFSIDLDSDRSGYFEYAKIGDTILKPTNKSMLQTIRNKKTRYFTISFGCK